MTQQKGIIIIKQGQNAIASLLCPRKCRINPRHIRLKPTLDLLFVPTNLAKLLFVELAKLVEVDFRQQASDFLSADLWHLQ